jgi:hypothetical protein
MAVQHGRPRDAGRPIDGEGLAKALGWFSIGLGGAQIVAPARMARLIGVDDDDKSTATMLAVGVREIAAGVGLLTQPRPAEWAWGRVAGDAMDLALVGLAPDLRPQQQRAADGGHARRAARDRRARRVLRPAPHQWAERLYDHVG